MNGLPFYIYVTFVTTLVCSYFLMARAVRFQKPFMLVAAIWIVAQAVVSSTGFYTDFSTVPPRSLFLLLPPVLLLTYTLSTRKGRAFLRTFDLKVLTLFHLIRLPVELVLYALFLQKAIPGLLTFEGRNFDILSGLTAPLVYYGVFTSKRLGRATLLVWNIVCLALVSSVVVFSVLSSPTPFQQLCFDQPNVGLFYFPFALLPSFLVPMVILSHASAITQLLNKPSL